MLAMMGAAPAPATAKPAKHAKRAHATSSGSFLSSIRTPAMHRRCRLPGSRAFGSWSTGRRSSRPPGPSTGATTTRKFSNIASAGISPAAQFSATPPLDLVQPEPPPDLQQRTGRRLAANFLTNFARRYGPGGTFWAEHASLPYRPVTSWEIWNEAESQRVPGAVPRAHATTWGSSRTSRQAIRGVDPAARVVFSGLFPNPCPGKGSRR